MRKHPKDWYDDSHIRFGQGLVVAVCLSIVIVWVGWAVFEAVMNYVGNIK